jgi:hypothetical protein
MNIDNFKFWDIVSAEIPFTDWKTTKIRPILILKKEREDYLVLRISSVISSKEDFDIELSPDAINNLKITSLIKIGKIGLFHKYIMRKLKENMKKFIDSF